MTKNIESLRQELQRAKDRLTELMDALTFGDTDMYGSGLTLQATRLYIAKLEQEIKIAENNGLWTFEILCDLDGNEVSRKLIRTRYGLAYIVEREGQDVEFVSPTVKPTTLEKKGYQLRRIELPARVSIHDDQVRVYMVD